MVWSCHCIFLSGYILRAFSSGLTLLRFRHAHSEQKTNGFEKTKLRLLEKLKTKKSERVRNKINGVGGGIWMYVVCLFLAGACLLVTNWWMYSTTWRYACVLNVWNGIPKAMTVYTHVRYNMNTALCNSCICICTNSIIDYFWAVYVSCFTCYIFASCSICNIQSLLTKS